MNMDMLFNHLSEAQTEELKFWDHELTLKGSFADFLKKRISPDLRKEEYPSLIFDSLVAQLSEKFPDERPFRCIELGSGPLSNLAYGVDKGEIRVIAVDSLAKEYHHLYEKYNLKDYPIKPICGYGESLDELFERDSFHCAYARNALDHTKDIVLSFKNLVSLVKRNGYIILEHTLREGSRQNWSDAHGWDLEFTERGLVAFNKKGKAFYLQENCHLGYAYIYYSSLEFNRWLSIAFKKL